MKQTESSGMWGREWTVWNRLFFFAGLSFALAGGGVNISRRDADYFGYWICAHGAV